MAGYAGLLNPFTLVDGVVSGPLGAGSVMATAPDGPVMGAVFSLAALLVVVGCYGALLLRFKRAVS